MEIEELLLIFAFLTLIFDLAQLSKSKLSNRKNLETRVYVSALGFGFIFAAFLMFAKSFLTNDFSIKEVFSYSSSGLPVLSKFCASWAGGGGSLLFLTLLIGATYLLYRFRGSSNLSANRETAKFLNVLLVFFLILVIMKNPFARFSATPSEGAGLNPQLQTLWMAAHPPIVFAAYVFIALAFALIIGDMKTEMETGLRLFRLSTQLAWLLLTIGIAMGGMWAYEVLGWGGYWAWDPVETGSLLTWLALTAYFHTGQSPNSGRNLTASFMMLMTFMALIFLSALTRGGLLQSVHAYALSPAGPALLSFALGVSLYFFHLKRKFKKPLFSFSLNSKEFSTGSLSLRISYFSLILIFTVAFFGTAYPIAGKLFISDPWTPGVDFYNNASFPFVIAFTAALIGCSLGDKIGLKAFAATVLSCLALGAALTWLNWPARNMLANIGLPPAVVAFLATVYGFIRILVRREGRSFRLLSRSILHIGIVVTLLGIFLSAGGQQAATSTLQLNAAEATQVALGVHMSLKAVTGLRSTGTVYSSDFDALVPEYSALRVDVDVSSGESIRSETLLVYLYLNYGPVSRPAIIHLVSGDIYMHVSLTQDVYNALVQALMGIAPQPKGVTVAVQTFPLIYLLWMGVTVMCVGIALPLIGEVLRKPKEDLSASGKYGMGRASKR